MTISGPALTQELETHPMTTVPGEVARKRPANTPVRREPETIDGEVVTRRDVGWTIAGWFVGLLLAVLLAGFLLSMLQQAS